LAKESTNQQPDMMPLPASAEIHPKGLLEAISYIDQQFANELGGCIINSRFLTTKQRIEFMEVGFRSSFVSGLVSALLTPVAIGAIERYIPIFGNPSPNIFDMLAALMLALCFSLGYAAFIAKSSTQYIGEYTKAMVRNLLGGMFFGAVVKAVLVVIAFHTIYFFLFTDKNVLWITSKFYYMKMTEQQVAGVYYWIQGFKSIFLTSSYFVLVSTFIFVVIPFVAYYWASLRNKRLIKAGVIRVENKAF
jgi:hypothetical protein